MAALPNDSQTSTSPREAPRPWLLVALVLTVVLLSYATALTAPFLWDDHVLVGDDVLGSGRSLLDHVREPFWREDEKGLGNQSYFRPLTTLSFALDAAWSGDNPVGFHATNLLLHAGVVALLYRLSRRLGAGLVPALLGALLFGVAPRLTESVTWISGRTDILAALLGLGALLVHPLHALDPPPARAALRRWGAALLVLLGMASKEVALAFALVIAVDELRSFRRGQGAFRSHLTHLVPMGAALTVYAVWRVQALGTGANEAAADVGPRALVALETLGRYATMLVDAFRPDTQIGDLMIRDHRYTLLGAGLVLLAFVLLVRRHGRSPWPRGVSQGLALAAFGLAPVLQVIPLPMNVVAADRFLYVPLIGLALAGAAGASSLSPARARLAAAVAAGWALASIAGTVMRNRDYRSELAFWLEAVQRAEPHNPLPFHELASVYYRANEYAHALGLYCKAAELKVERTGPTPRVLGLVTTHLSIALSGLGRYDEAARLNERMLQRGVPVPRIVFNAALVHLHREDFARARQLTQQALELLPDYPAARAVLEAIPKLEREKAELSGLAGPERLAREANYYWRIGARPEAQQAYLGLLQEGAPNPAIEKEALTFLLTSGSAKAVKRAIERHPPTDPELLAVLATRVEFAREMHEMEPIVRSYMAKCDPKRLGL